MKHLFCLTHLFLFFFAFQFTNPTFGGGCPSSQICASRTEAGDCVCKSCGEGELADPKTGLSCIPAPKCLEGVPYLSAIDDTTSAYVCAKQCGFSNAPPYTGNEPGTEGKSMCIPKCTAPSVPFINFDPKTGESISFGCSDIGLDACSKSNEVYDPIAKLCVTCPRGQMADLNKQACVKTYTPPNEANEELACSKFNNATQFFFFDSLRRYCRSCPNGQIPDTTTDYSCVLPEQLPGPGGCSDQKVHINGLCLQCPDHLIPNSTKTDCVLPPSNQPIACPVDQGFVVVKGTQGPVCFLCPLPMKPNAVGDNCIYPPLMDPPMIQTPHIGGF